MAIANETKPCNKTISEHKKSLLFASLGPWLITHMEHLQTKHFLNSLPEEEIFCGTRRRQKCFHFFGMMKVNFQLLQKLKKI